MTILHQDRYMSEIRRKFRVCQSGLVGRLPLLAALIFFAFGGLSWAQTTWPLAAVGRIGTGENFGCSATLIEPDIVLTAAHCATGMMDQPDTHFFQTGAYPGLPAVRRQVTDVSVHPFFLLNLGSEVARVRFDLALLLLAEPIEDPRILPITLTSTPEVGESLLLAGYRSGLGERARERRCMVFETVREAFAIGCEVLGGESGSPVLRVTEDGLRVAAVLTSRTRVEAQPIGLAASVSPRIDPVRDALPSP